MEEFYQFHPKTVGIFEVVVGRCSESIFKKTKIYVILTLVVVTVSNHDTRTTRRPDFEFSTVFPSPLLSSELLPELKKIVKMGIAIHF